MAEKLKVLAIAAATGRISYVFFTAGKLRDWGLSKKASKSPSLAAKQAKRWINHLEPDVVITENVEAHSKKSSHTKDLIAAIAGAAADRPLLDLQITRIQTFKNKYAEAKAFAARFPEIAPWLPTFRLIWDAEPRNAVYIDALALAVAVIDGAADLEAAKQLRLQSDW